MPAQHDPFFSRRVDESIEHIMSAGQSSSPSHFQEHADASELLVSDMQRLYSLERKRYLQALQRVEDRLMKQYVAGDKQTVADPVAPGQQQRSLRRMQQGKLYHMEQKQPSAFGRRLSLLVAIIVMALLVGSLVFALNITRQKTAVRQQHTPLGSVQSPALPVSFGKTLYTTPGNRFGFEELSWSPDSKRVASFTDSIQIWDATTGGHRVTVHLPGGVWPYALAWSPHSSLVAIGTSTGIVIADGESGAIIHTYGVNGSARSINATSGPYLSTFIPTSGGLGVRGLAWSPDGRFLAVSISAGASGTLEVLNAQTGAQAYTLPVSGNYVTTALAWSSDGKFIAANTFNTEPGMQTVPLAEQQMIWAWKVSTRQVTFKHSGGNGTGDPVAWQPGGDNLAFVAWNPRKGSGLTSSLAIWNIAANKLVRQYQVAAFGPLAWSPEGKYLAYVGYSKSDRGAASQVSVLDVTSGLQIYTYRQQHLNIGALSWSPNGKYIASGEGNTSGEMVARVWTAE